MHALPLILLEFPLFRGGGNSLTNTESIAKTPRREPLNARHVALDELFAIAVCH